MSGLRKVPIASTMPEDTAPPLWPRRSSHALPLAATLLLGLLAYSNSLHGPFVFDDRQHIRDNPVIRDLSNYLGSWTGYRGMPDRFIAYLTFALNYRLGGLEVVGYHAFNLGVHLLCAMLLYAFVLLTFQTPRLAPSSLASSARSVAFAASALFATHPIQTQAVTYIVQRITSLATLFYLLSIILYVCFRLARDAEPTCLARNAITYALALLAAIAAMRTKEIAFTLPFALIFYELFFFPKANNRLVLLVPFLATSLIIPLTLVNPHSPLAEVLAKASERTRVETTAPRLDYLRTQLAVIVTYLRLLVLPIGQNLDHDYPLYRSFLAPRVLCSLSFIVLILAGATWLWWRSSPQLGQRAFDPSARLLAYCVTWFFLTLLVESSVIPILDLANEHRVYLPSIGFFTATATVLGLLCRRVSRSEPGRLTWLTALFFAILLTVATLRRNEVWASDISLWADAAAKSPVKARPFYNLGSALATAGYPEQGILALQRAVQLDPSLARAHAQLGATLLAEGRVSLAEPEIRQAIRLDPKSPEPVFNLAMLLLRTRRPSEASRWFRRFLEIAPPSYEAARRVAMSRATSP